MEFCQIAKKANGLFGQLFSPKISHFSQFTSVRALVFHCNEIRTLDALNESKPNMSTEHAQCYVAVLAEYTFPLFEFESCPNGCRYDIDSAY